MDEVRKDRGVYLAAVFTIIRAFREAGSPEPSAGKMKIVAGFEKWSKLIQQALIWLDQPDPVGSMEDMRAMDPMQEEKRPMSPVLEVSERENFIRNWRKRHVAHIAAAMPRARPVPPGRS